MAPSASFPDSGRRGYWRSKRAIGQKQAFDSLTPTVGCQLKAVIRTA
jgi:hypothetical protein